jgi:1,4-alpha-glucan branching enzyme
MLDTGKQHGLPGAEPAELLNLDPTNQVLCARRGDLVFVFNLSTDRSIPDYKFPVPGRDSYRLVLDTDASAFGGHARVDAAIEYPVATDGTLSIYTPARTAMVFAPL